MFAWARIPEPYRHLGSIDFATKLVRECDVAVSPGVGFGPQGDGFVRFALIENEHRIAQAARSLRRGCPSCADPAPHATHSDSAISVVPSSDQTHRRGPTLHQGARLRPAAPLPRPGRGFLRWRRALGSWRRWPRVVAGSIRGYLAYAVNGCGDQRRRAVPSHGDRAMLVRRRTARASGDVAVRARSTGSRGRGQIVLVAGRSHGRQPGRRPWSVDDWQRCVVARLRARTVAGRRCWRPGRHLRPC